MQVTWTNNGRRLHSLEMQPASTEVVPGVVWGCATELAARHGCRIP